jgi:DNA invertase Pin-like site-specific DNA recombinase
MSEKIRPQNLERKAILYIRQSSAYQVTHNLESQKLQYAMQERLRQLGWREIEVVDEDLGRSAAGTVARTGFERMVSEVCLGKVGAVAAREVSRFARNSREWQRLVEVCRVVDTILIDQETIYAPRHSNDRLLLGLKGSLNEYELDLLRQRSVEARREKARRGELVVSAPVGYWKTEDQRLEKHPDRRPRYDPGGGWLLADHQRHIMIHPARLQALAKNSKPSSRRNRLVSRSPEPFAVSQKSHILTCAASLNSPHRGPPKSFQRLPAECSRFGVSDSQIKTHSSDT